MALRGTPRAAVTVCTALPGGSRPPHRVSRRGVPGGAWWSRRAGIVRRAGDALYSGHRQSLAVTPTTLVNPEDEDDDARLLAGRSQADADLDDPIPATGGRLRHLPEDVRWPVESEHDRDLRRRRLAECDQLLGAIEEHNYRYGQVPVPVHLVNWYHALGGVRRAVRRGDALIEAVFELPAPPDPAAPAPRGTPLPPPAPAPPGQMICARSA